MTVLTVVGVAAQFALIWRIHIKGIEVPEWNSW